MQRQITAARYCIPSADWCQTEKSTGAPTATAGFKLTKCARHNRVSTKSWHWVAKTRLVVRPSIILKYREILVISRFGSYINHCWNIARLLKTLSKKTRHTMTSNILSHKQFPATSPGIEVLPNAPGIKVTTSSKVSPVMGMSGPDSSHCGLYHQVRRYDPKVDDRWWR